MYKIFADSTLIYDSTLEDYKIGKGTVSLEVNKSGSFVFSVYPDHFYYDSFVKLKTVITVYRSGKIVFRGRILNDVTDYWNNKTITCEGEMGFLQDSIIRPFSFSGTPEALFTKFIEEHNAQVDEFKRFKIGTVTIEDANDYISRSNSGYESALSNLNSRLIEDSLGGFFFITHGEDGTEEIPTINYLADFTSLSSQVVEFGSNLKDYTKSAKAEDMATAIIPLGAADESGTGTNKPKLTIKSVNGGVDYVYDADAVALYGWIFKVVTWDDVTVAANLKTKAQAYLKTVVEQNVTVELNAIDLHLLDKTIESFNVCDYIRVISKPHNFDSTLLCNKQTLDLLKPENDCLILGYTPSTLTGQSNGVKSSIKALESNSTVMSSKMQNFENEYAKKSDINATVNEYLESEDGKAAIESTLSATVVTRDELTGYVKETELSTKIGQYIDTEAGTASVVAAVEGSFVKKDVLNGYVEKTELSTEIGAYIDTAAGTAKIVTAAEGTYQKKSDMTGYVTTTTLNTSIGQYIDSTAGTAKIVSAVSGTYQKKSDMSGYVTETSLNTSIGQYIDSATGKAKVVSAVSGTYQTISGMSDYAKTTAVSTIEQSVSDVEAAITLSSSYTEDTIGTNVYALLQLVSNANSSSIKVKADKIDFTGFTTFVRPDDLKSNGTTAIDGGRITTGTISADRIDVDSLHVTTIYGTGTYDDEVLLTTSGNYVYVGGENADAAALYTYIMATNTIYFGGSTAKLLRLYMTDKSFGPESAGNTILGSTTYPWGSAYLGYYSGYYWKISNACIVPSATLTSSNTSYFNIGSSSYPITTLYVKHIDQESDGKLGFFGATPIAKQTLSTSSNNMSYSSATSSNYLTVLNNLVGILKNKYGLIA